MTSPLLGSEELTGEVVGVVYRDTATGFGVVEINSGETGGVRCAGPLSTLVEGQHVKLTGRTVDDPRYGTTFRAVYYEQVTPTTTPAVTRFLTSEHFAFLDENMVVKIVSAFGADTGRVIEQQPDRLVDEAGIDTAIADRVVAAWKQGRVFSELLAHVTPFDWATRMTAAVFAAHGVEALDVVRQRPYDCIVLPHVRFSPLDRAGRAARISQHDPARLRAAARAAVGSATTKGGHQHLVLDHALAATSQLANVDAVLARSAVDDAVGKGLLAADRVADESIVALPAALAAEQGLAEQLRRLVNAENTAVQALGGPSDARTILTDDQAAAVAMCLSAPVTVITGGPGTGKTHLLSTLVNLVAAANLHVALCAPTGRAAKRLEELTGTPATTIHRLLEAKATEDGFSFRYGMHDQLPMELVVIDEVSMCDTWLLWQLTQAIRSGTHVVFVGDPDQLPSVGAGAVLRDMILAPQIPTAKLETVHRQAQDSAIVTLAHHVRVGQVPALTHVANELYFAEETQPDRLIERVVRAVTVGIPDHLGIASDDVQVLAPVYGGAVGVDALNTALKTACNPPTSHPDVGGFHRGDRVMQTRNNVALGVANGDIGTVVDVNRGQARLSVRFPLGDVVYGRSDTRELRLAWAVTVHKAQGGEWPAVIFVCDRAHHHMHWRNLLYTAITRAQSALIVMGQRAAFTRGVHRARENARHTGLVARIQAPPT